MNGKLYGSMVYLSGPIDASPDLGIGWRQQITPFLQNLGMDVFDPTNKPIDEMMFGEGAENHEYRKKLKKEGKYQELYNIGHPIRCVDLRATDKADILIVYLDISIVMCGTWEELFTGNKSKKPCLLFCAQGKEKIPDWIYWTLPNWCIFNNIDEIKEHLIKVNNGEFNDKRYMLFDYNKLRANNVTP